VMIRCVSDAKGAEGTLEDDWTESKTPGLILGIFA